MTSAPSLGILELSDRGAGFVRRRQFSYLAEDGDLCARCEDVVNGQ